MTSDLKRVGKTYFVAGFTNPLAVLPARVSPVFQQLNTGPADKRIYAQVCDEFDEIEDFRLIANSSNSLISWTSLNQATSKRLLTGINQPKVHAFAVASNRCYMAKGKDDFVAILKQLIKSKDGVEIRRWPMMGVEVSRYIEDDRSEAQFAKSVISEIVQYSVVAAEGWLANAPLSDLAHQKASKSLSRWKREHELDEPVIQMRAIRRGSHATTQGEYVRTLNNGHIVLKMGCEYFYGPPVVKG